MKDLRDHAQKPPWCFLWEVGVRVHARSQGRELGVSGKTLQRSRNRTEVAGQGDVCWNDEGMGCPSQCFTEQRRTAHESLCVPCNMVALFKDVDTVLIRNSEQ